MPRICQIADRIQPEVGAHPETTGGWTCSHYILDLYTYTGQMEFLDCTLGQIDLRVA